MAKVTIADVAQEAGVSRSTVSRVLNRNPSVDPALRKKVIKVINELGYKPTTGWSFSRRFQTGNIGLFLALLTDSLSSDVFFTKLIQGIEDVLAERNLTLSVATSGREDYQASLPNMINERKIDGLIVGGGLVGSEWIETLLNLNLPVVVFDRYMEDRVSGVIVDHASCMKKIVHHLVELGHKRIGIVNGPENVPACDDKQEGYQLALEAESLALDTELIVRHRQYHTSKGGYEAMNKLLERAHCPTAVVVSDDLMAYGVLDAIRDSGRRVPEDIAVVGYGDLLYEQLGIPLTSIRMDFVVIGRMVARLLVDTIEGKVHSPLQIALRPPLVIRETCGYRENNRRSKEPRNSGW